MSTVFGSNELNLWLKVFKIAPRVLFFVSGTLIEMKIKHTAVKTLNKLKACTPITLSRHGKPRVTKRLMNQFEISKIVRAPSRTFCGNSSNE